MAKKEFPSWRYGPGGQSQIFQEGDTVPDGWEDHPDKVKAAAKPQGGAKGKGKAAKPADPPQTPPARAEATGTDDEQAAEEQRYRAEVIEYLKAAGLDFDENASLEELEAKMNAEG